MNNLNMELFDAFNRLEKLCNDQYGQIHGVTLYLNDMKSVPPHQTKTVPGWINDYRHLVRVRNIRNDLGHDPGAFEYMDATEDDVAFLEDFRRRILNQTDPLTMLRRSRCADRDDPQQHAVQMPVQNRSTRPTPEHHTRTGRRSKHKAFLPSALIGFLCIFLLPLALILLFIYLL